MTPSKPIRVAYLNPFPDLGGAEHSLLTLLKSLPEGLDPFVLTDRAGELTQRLAAAGIPHQAVSIPGLGHWSGFRSALGRVTELLRDQQIDVIHGNSPRGALVGGLVARRLQVPSIWHMRVHLGRGVRPRILRRLNQRWIAVSASLLHEAGITAQHARATVIPNGVAPEFWRPEARPLRRTREPRIGMIGRLEPLKGVKEFVETAFLFQKKHLPGSFVIGGGIVGPAAGKPLRRAEQYVDTLKQRIDQEGMSDRVSFIGPVHRVAEFLDSLDMLVVPSHMEGFGRVVIEGMARGLPVVASHIGGIPEIIDTGKNGWLVPRRDPKALFLACRFLLRNPHMAHRMGEAGRRKVRDRYLAGHTTAAIVNVYEELLGRELPRSIPPLLSEEVSESCTSQSI